MSTLFPFKVNNVDMPVPSKFAWSLQDVSAPDSGRTLDAVMWKNRVAQKEKIALEWLGCTPAVAATILTAFNAEYFNVTYRCPMTNTVVTKEFYRGDASAPYYWWCDGGRHENVAFDIIER